MAEKTLQTRIKLKYDTLTNWQDAGADVVLLKGEVGICEVLNCFFMVEGFILMF